MRSCFAILALFGVSACAALPKSEKGVADNASLSARTLAPGECGLFVWTADPSKHFILFSQSQKSSGVWVSETREQSVVISERSGTPSDGQYPIQVYNEAGLKLALKEPQTITQGTRFKAGTLTQQSEQGWSKVTPVVGLSTCQPG